MSSSLPSGRLAALQDRDFRRYWLAQGLSFIASKMQDAAFLWHLYLLTKSPYALGLVGLVRVLPLLAFVLLGGLVADAVNRKRLIVAAQGLMALLAGLLAVWALSGGQGVWPIYLAAGINAAATGFDIPARQSLIPLLVSRERLTNAVSLNSITVKAASIIGPALMGLLLIHFQIGVVYGLAAVIFIAATIPVLAMRYRETRDEMKRRAMDVAALFEGLRFMRHSRLLLTVMALDFVANFWASAATLLPIYATDVLRVGPSGYGWLAASPAVGALLAALVLTLMTKIPRQGVVMLWAVGIFAGATIAFGLSRSFALCFIALAVTGAADTVSVVLRNTIRHLNTPDALQGRMTSINMIFVKSGPQLGELEAGLVAGWMGVTFSVVSGGIGCLITVGCLAFFAPWLRQYQGHEALDEGHLTED